MPTDQKVGGSSPSERAQVNGPYPFRGGAFLVSVGAMLGATTADPGAARWLARLDPATTAEGPWRGRGGRARQATRVGLSPA